jgi:hypothetical protein
MSPATADITSEPLAGVRISAAGKTAITDGQGYYHISGLPIGSTVLLSIDQTSLDPRYVAELPIIPVRLPPGALLQYDPIITTTVGMDGHVLTRTDLPKDLKIFICRKAPHAIKIPGKLFFDQNYFVFENLMPGIYLITFEGIDNPPAPYEVDIPKGVDWVSDKDIPFNQAKHSSINQAAVSS